MRTPVDSNEVSDGYFDLLQIPVIRGRAVSPGDDAHARPVVVVNQAAASILWPGELPLRRRLRLKGETADREVVGVVANSRYRPLGEVETARPVIFPPILQRLPQEVVLHVRTPVPPGRYEEPLRRVVGRVAAGLPLSGTETLDERLESGLARERLVAHAATMVGAVGVLLAIVGVFAAGAYRVAQGKREIAIRLSVGAGPGRIVRSHAARGVAISLCGSLVGAVPASWTAALLRASLRGVGVPGFWLFATSGLALIASASLASWLAARRAAQIEPVAVLKVQ